jgi:hypothetical protein
MSPLISAIDSYLTLTFFASLCAGARAPYTGICRGQTMSAPKRRLRRPMSIKYISFIWRHSDEKRQRNQLVVIIDAVICCIYLKPGPLTQNRDNQWNSLWVYHHFHTVMAYTSSQCIIKHHAMKMDGGMFHCIYITYAPDYMEVVRFTDRSLCRQGRTPPPPVPTK